jgi:hypothetical protein
MTQHKLLSNFCKIYALRYYFKYQR